MAIIPKYHQFDCVEKNEPDDRQADAILKYRPDIIILEGPEREGKPDLIFNAYGPHEKPKKEIADVMDGLRIASKQFGYAVSDMKAFENVQRLWNEGHNVLEYGVDGPKELRSEFYEVWNHCYPCAKKNWLWWVHIYLRERIMANHMANILKNYQDKPNPVILILLQSFHWKHVKFLLKNPSKVQVWGYYFGKFPEVTPETIAEMIKRNNKVFYKYWMKYSDFKE